MKSILLVVATLVVFASSTPATKTVMPAEPAKAATPAKPNKTATPATLAKPTTPTKSTDPTFPPTKRGVKCQYPGDSPPRCPAGFFCPQDIGRDGFCYQRLELDMPCYADWNDCASPNYCRRDWDANDAGKCATPGVEGASCGGHFNEECARNLSCLTPDGNLGAGGKCVTLPRKTGEICNADYYCSKTDYCQLKAQGVFAGVCTRRAQLKEECADNERYPLLAPPCADGLGCFITTEGGKGTCYSNNAKIGDKCSLYGTLGCEKGLYCKYDAPKVYHGVCDKVRQLGEKCVYNFDHEIPCADKLSCYFEDTDMNGVCMNTNNNPIDSKCNENGVNCADNAFCKFETGKRYGMCTRALALGEKCSVTSVAGLIPCSSNLSCYHEDDVNNGVCMKSWGNPIGSKCLNYSVNCIQGAICKTEAGKKYGVCATKQK